MNIGKLSVEQLKCLIDSSHGIKRKDVRISSGIGEDCSVIEYGDYECVVSTDPITAAGNGIGKLAVNINCNDIASCGVEVVGILVTILAPETSSFSDIKSVMSEIDSECKKLNLEILGGHTEVTSAVNRIVVSCTAIGKGQKNTAISTGGAKIGDDIIVTKKLAMEGTFITVSDKYEKIKNILNDDEIEEAKNYIEAISVVKEGRIAGEYGAHSMHDITEGGVLGALFEVANASNCGFKVYGDAMPISNVTQKVCKEFRVDPLRLISSGSMLITCSEGEALVELLRANHIEATIIGKITEQNGILINNNIEEEVLPPGSDELFKIVK